MKNASNSSLAVLTVFLGCWILLEQSRSWACSSPGNTEQTLDPAEKAVDTTPPGKPQLALAVLDRTTKDDALCPNLVMLSVIDVSDDRTRGEDMGFILSSVSSSAPAGFGLSHGPGVAVLALPEDAAHRGELYLYWMDSPEEWEKPIDFWFTIAALDLAGNVRPDSDPIRIIDFQATSGCASGATSTSIGSNLWAGLGIVLAKLIARMGHRGQGRLPPRRSPDLR